MSGHIGLDPIVARECRICQAVIQRLDNHLKRVHHFYPGSPEYREELNLAPVSTKTLYILNYNIFQKYSKDEIEAQIYLILLICE